MHELIKLAKKEGCKGLVIDNDETVCRNSARYIGQKFLEREARRGNFLNVLDGLYGLLKINMDIMRNGGEEDTRALKTLCQTLGKTGCADVKSAYAYALENVKKNSLEGVGSFISDAKKELGPVYLATHGLNVSADATMDYYDMDGRVSNPHVSKVKKPVLGTNKIKEFRETQSPFAYKGEKKIPMNGSVIVDCEPVMITGPHKENGVTKLLAPKNLDLAEMLAIGDKFKIDKDFLKKALLSACSPNGDEPAKKNTHYQIESFAG